SATGMICFFLFANLGLERASASLGALVQGLAPVLIAVLAVTFLGERPTPRVVSGIVLALAGAAVLAWGAIHVASALGLVFLFLSAAREDGARKSTRLNSSHVAISYGL